MKKPHLFGLIAPLFSVHSSTSCYRGDFQDLISLIELVSSFGGNYLQFLPFQDTCGVDSPYSLNSWFALDIRYIYVEGLATSQPISLKEQIVRKREKMFSLFNQKKSDPGFQNEMALFRKNNPWVLSYACFKTLEQKFKTSSWKMWEKEYLNPTPDLLKSIESKNTDPVLFEIFIQMTGFAQLEKAAKIAKEKGVHLCCDLPHFCDGDGVENWNNPSLFLPHLSVGAPPDAFSKTGQNWNLAPWNWEGNFNDVAKLWKDRNDLFSRYFTFVRVDHAVGIFRQWVIPEGKSASKGEFHPPNLKDALDLGKSTFLSLQKSPTELIAENLGLIPPEVNRTLRDLDITGTIVWRWNRRWNTPGEPFIPLHEMEEDNILSFTTHDTPTIEGWARSEYGNFKLFCSTFSVPCPPKAKEGKTLIDRELRYQILKLLGSAPCRIKADLIEEFLLLEEEFGEQDPNLQRVNDPAHPEKQNWTYRCKPSLETLAASSSWKEKMEKIVACNRS